uniref:Uncharacterized protein n=1 Tax=Cacopsylla melanoneura TaxID=428564 RepID=A0A8D9AHC2_9HEMI
MLQTENIGNNTQQAQSCQQDPEGLKERISPENQPLETFKSTGTAPDNIIEKVDLNRDLILSHKADLIESLAKKQNILTDTLQMSSPQKPLTSELKTHLAEKSELVKEILKIESIIDRELESTATVTFSSDVEPDQALSPDDKCKLLNEIKTIDNILDSRSPIKIETLQKTEAKFAQTGEVQILLEKAALINKSIRPRTENIEKKPDQGKLDQMPSDDKNIKDGKISPQKETVTEKLQGDVSLKNLQVDQVKILSQKAELIESLIKKEDLINEMFKISEPQKHLTVELKYQLTGKSDIINELLKVEETLDQALNRHSDHNKDLTVEVFKTSQALSVEDKKILLQEVSLIENISNKRGLTIESFQQAEAQYVHEVENLLEKAKIIESALKQQHIETVHFEVFNLKLENVNDLMKQAKVIEVLMNTNVTQEEFSNIATLQYLTTEQKSELYHKKMGIQNLLEGKSDKEVMFSVNDLEILSQKAKVIDSLLKLEELSMNQADHEKTTKISEEQKNLLLKKTELIESLLQKGDEKELIDDLQKTAYLSFNEVNSLYQQAKCIEIMLKPDMSAEELENLTKLQKLTTKQQNTLSDRATNLLKLSKKSKGKLPKELDGAILKAQKIQSLLNLESEIVTTAGNEKLQPELLKEKAELIQCILKQEAMEPYKHQLFTVEETKKLAQRAKHLIELVEKVTKPGENESEELQSTLNKESIDELTNKYKKLQDVLKEENLYLEVLNMPESQKTNIHKNLDIVQQQTELLENLIQVETTLESKMGADKILLQKQRATIIQDILKKEIMKDTILGTKPEQSFIEPEKYKTKDNLDTTDSTEELKRNKEDQKDKAINAEKDKKEEAEKLEAEKKTKEDDDKARVEAEKKKKEVEEKAKVETEKKKKEEEEKAKVEAEKQKKQEEEKVKLEVEKKKKEEEEKAKLEAEKKKKEEEEKAKLEAEEKKKEEEEREINHHVELVFRGP